MIDDLKSRTALNNQSSIINKKATLIYFEGWPVGSQKQF